ncbi:MAG: alkane 1-monooxygenase [Solimonas sp.]
MSTTATLAPVWRDNKRYLWPLGGIIMLLVPIAGVLYGATGWGGWWWLGPMVVYGLIPIADLFVGADASDPPEARVPSLEKERYYRWAEYMAVACEYVSVIWGAWTAVRGGLPWYDVFGLAITIAMVTGVSINTGHELGHKTDRLEQWLAKLALAPTAYGHFFVEHNRGHHVRVATPEDPASSRFGESFWSFLPRTMLGSLKSAWEIEARRLERNGQPVWSVRNHNLNAWAMTAALFSGLALWLGWQAPRSVSVDRSPAGQIPPPGAAHRLRCAAFFVQPATTEASETVICRSRSGAA